MDKIFQVQGNSANSILKHFQLVRQKMFYNINLGIFLNLENLLHKQNIFSESSLWNSLNNSIGKLYCNNCSTSSSPRMKSLLKVKFKIAYIVKFSSEGNKTDKYAVFHHKTLIVGSECALELRFKSFTFAYYAA